MLLLDKNGMTIAAHAPSGERLAHLGLEFRVSEQLTMLSI